MNRRFFATIVTKKKASLSTYPFLKELGISKNNSGVYHSGK
jgi:hypothetical protein